MNMMNMRRKMDIMNYIIVMDELPILAACISAWEARCSPWKVGRRTED